MENPNMGKTLKNIGSINGKVEILHDEETKTTALIGASNFTQFNAAEIMALVFVLNFLNDQQTVGFTYKPNLAELPNFQPTKEPTI